MSYIQPQNVFAVVFITVSVMQELLTCFDRKHSRQHQVYRSYTGWFRTNGHYNRRWFLRSVRSKSSYKSVSDFKGLQIYGCL